MLAAGLVLAQIATAQVPPGLSCLSKYYVGAAAERDGGWVLALPDGGALPWNDGRTKRFDEQIDSPDLKDMFSVRYRPGAIQPVSEPGDDPGRIRLDALFKATYGERADAVDLVHVDFVGECVAFHRRAAPALERVSHRLEALLAEDPSLRAWLTPLGGTFLWRKIANTGRQSPHSYGIAIDLNVAHSFYWEWAKPREPVRWQSSTPQALVDAFEAEGFIWAGRWHHYDTMHFEWRPELRDPSCFPPSPSKGQGVHP